MGGKCAWQLGRVVGHLCGSIEGGTYAIASRGRTVQALSSGALNARRSNASTATASTRVRPQAVGRDERAEAGDGIAKAAQANNSADGGSQKEEEEEREGGSYFDSAVQPVLQKPFNGAEPGSLEKDTLQRKMILECDKALILSRGSSDPKSFVMAKTCLTRAANIYWQLLEHSTFAHGGFAKVVLDYETYVLRSSYAHVMRIVGALAGRQSVLVCSAIMSDFLLYEKALQDSGMAVPDGSGKWMESRRRAIGPAMSMKRREEELQEIYLIAAGPFVHDIAPILYDLFADLTTREEPSQSSGSTIFLRGFTSTAHQAATHKMWTCLRQLPAHTWAGLDTVDRQQFRHQVHANMNLRTGGDVIDACTTMYLNACLQSGSMKSAVAVWRDSVALNGSDTNKGERLLGLVAKKLRHDRRSLSRQIAHPVWIEDREELHKRVSAYTQSMTLFAGILRDSKDNSAMQETLSASNHLDTILRCLLKSDFIVDQKAGEECQPAVAYEEACQSIVQWLVYQLASSNIPSAAPTQRGISTSTCNALLTHLLRRGSHHPQSEEVFVQLLKAMISGSRFPGPNRATWTVMLNAAACLPDVRMIPASLTAAYQMIPIPPRQIGSSSESATDAGASSTKLQESSGDIYGNGDLIVALIRDAASKGDLHRLMAILKLARHSHSINSTSMRNGRSIVVPPVSASRVVFTLYPSLNIYRSEHRGVGRKQSWRLKRKIEGEEKGIVLIRSTAEEISKRENAVQFDLTVMTSVLRLLVGRRKTGLAERFWRLMQRVVNRKVARQRRMVTVKKDQKPTTTMPLTAFAEMFRLYGFEQRGAAKVRRLRALPPYKRVGIRPDHRSLLAQDVVRGWSRTGESATGHSTWPGAGPVVTSRSAAAREGAMRCYEQLRQSWPMHDPSSCDASAQPGSHLYTLLLAIFRASGSIRTAAALDPTLTASQRSFVRIVLGDMRCLNIPVSQNLNLDA